MTRAADQLSIRTVTEDELPEFAAILTAAFLSDHSEEYLDEIRLGFEPGRCHAVFDGETMIGVGQLLSRRLVFPGTGPVPSAAVTSIGVAPGHRRRGALSMIMRGQLEAIHESGESTAILWAAEGGIYGRFGYGIATRFARLEVPRGAEFRSDVAVDPRPVREVPRDEALPLLRELYQRVWRDRVGYLSRADGDWEYHMHDAERMRGDLSKLRFAVHPDGYAVYRVKANWEYRGPRAELVAHSLVATNPAAYAAIVRYLLDVDMVGEVIFKLAVDEPLIHQLADPRAAQCRIFDGLWVRLADVDRALADRRYAVPVDVVLEVADELCPWNAGRWRLTADAYGEVKVGRTEAAADLALDVSALGAAFLGGTRLSSLAAAGLVHERTPGTLARTTLAFLHDQEPRCLEVF